MNMKRNQDTIFFAVISIIVLLVVNLPYLYAVKMGNDDYSFNGFLLNPFDGNSYLAKMYQGWQGKWRFQLPFTPDPGRGAYLFLFYLALGHIGRITNLSLLSVFHLTRIVCSLLMLWSIWEFYRVVLQSRRSREFAFLATTLGSGMGWVVVNWGLITSDFWIAEAFPFLSAFANPHFPLGLSLILGLITIWLEKRPGWELFTLTVLGSIALSIINPFGIVILLMIFSGLSLWQVSKKTEVKPIIRGLLTISLSGLPLLIYDYWVANTDPVLRIWNEQNLTPSPPLWDFIISFSPALLFGIWGLYCILNEKKAEKDTRTMVLPIWVVLGILSIYFPVGLQRRFMMGLFVPITGLAAKGMENFSRGNRKRYFISIIIFFILAIPSNLITLLAVLSGIQTRNPQIFLSVDEVSTLGWIEENTRPDSIVLCSPEMGLFIPAYIGRRVIYGHPFESVNALETKKIVTDFYSGILPEEQVDQLIRKFQVDFVMVGPRERSLGEIKIPSDWLEIYHRGGISLYDP